MPSEVESNDLRSDATQMLSNTDQAQASQLTPGEWVNASSSDLDWFAIDVAQAGTLFLQVLRDSDLLTAEPIVEVVDSEGRVLDTFTLFIPTLITREVSVDAGTYYLRVTGNGLGSIDYALNASVSGVAAGEPNDTVGTASAIEVGHSTGGNIASTSDVDWYRVELDADARVLVTGSGQYYSTLDVRLADASGNLLYSAIGDRLIQFDAGIAAPGTYYVSVSAGVNYEASPYTLLVTNAPDVGVLELEPTNNSPSGASEFVFGEVMIGAVGSGTDIDWYHFRLDHASQVSFGGFAPAADLELIDANGASYGVIGFSSNTLTDNTDFGRLEAGDYHVRVSQSVGGSHTGTSQPYRITGTATPSTSLPNNSASSTPPDDELFATAYHLQAGARGVNAQAVWADYTGAGVLIAFVGGYGIDYRDRDLAGNFSASDSISLETGTPWTDPTGYLRGASSSTTQAALSASAERDGQGAVGVAYNSTVASLVKGWAVDALGTLEPALEYAVDADILVDFAPVMGWQPSTRFDSLSEELAGTGRDGLGTVVLRSARTYENTGYSLSTSDRHRVVVAETYEDGTRGEANSPSYGTSILVSAPAPSPLHLTRGTAADGATGVAAGVVALMLEANPDLGWRDVQEILAGTARLTDVSSELWSSNAANDWNGGGRHFNWEYGYGLIDARAAVRLAESWTEQSISANQVMVQASASPFAAIPDNSLTGVHSTVTLGAMNVEWVEIELSLPHTYMADLAIILTSAEGTVSLPYLSVSEYVMAGSNGTASFRLTMADFWGEQAGGPWTLSVLDLLPEDVGALNSWTIRAYGSALSADDTYVYTDEFGSLTDSLATRQSLNDANGGHDVVNLAALSAAAVVNLAGGSSTIAGRALSIAAGVIEDAYGGDGGDTITGNGLANLLQGARGDDALFGGAGNDTLLGGAGNDWLDGGTGLDVIDGGEGFDTVSFRSIGGAISVRQLGGGVSEITLADASVVQVLNIEGFDAAGGVATSGSVGADQFTGGEGGDVIALGAGNDYLAGSGGDDSLEGGDGQDWLWAGTGNDTLDGGSEKDNLNGEAGDDLLWAGDGDDRVTGRDGNDVIHAGTGNDWVGVWNDWGESPELNYFPEWGDDQIFGEEGDDVLSAGFGRDTVDGGLGNDYVAGEQDDDSLTGGEGQDWLWAGAGNDTLDGGAMKDNLNGEGGNDLIYAGEGDDRICGQQDNDEIHAGTGNDWVGVWNDWGEDPALNYFPEAGDDLIFGDEGNDVLSAGFGRDTVHGGADDDYVAGEQDDDQLFGNDGIDWLWGGSGTDTLDGGTGNDHLIGEEGLDLLTGGTGADIFAFHSLSHAGDRILDFSVSEGDLIDVSALLFEQNYFGADPFADGRLTRVQSGADVLLNFDTTLLASIDNITVAELQTNLFIV